MFLEPLRELLWAIYSNHDYVPYLIPIMTIKMQANDYDHVSSLLWNQLLHKTIRKSC